MLAPQDGVFGLGIYLLQLKHHYNNQKQQMTRYHLGCEIVSLKPLIHVVYAYVFIVNHPQTVPERIHNISNRFPGILDA